MRSSLRAVCSRRNRALDGTSFLAGERYQPSKQGSVAHSKLTVIDPAGRKVYEK
jgi:hypothetical protein